MTGRAHSSPDDFDSAAYPILARHFFSVGPLRPIGQVLPAVFTDLARTMVANTNSLQSRRIKHMTEQEHESLKTVIRYLWCDEQKHFDNCEINDGGAPDNHIFRHLETLRRYTTDDPVANTTV